MASLVPSEKYDFVDNVKDLPVEPERRQNHDIVCVCLNITLILVLLIYSFSILNISNLHKMSYPNDADGNTCGYDLPGFPLLYYTSLTNPANRVCVSSCPVAGEKILSCYKTKNLGCRANTSPSSQVKIYDSVIDDTRIGLFCYPSDPTLRDQLQASSGLSEKYNFLTFYDSIWMSIWVSIIFAVTFFLLMNYFPHKMVPWTILIGGILFAGLGFLFLLLSTGSVLPKILIFILCEFLAFCSFYTLFASKRIQAVFICARLIKTSVKLTTEKSIWDLLSAFMVIVIFLALFGVLLVLIGFEILAVWSCGNLQFVRDYPFYNVTGASSYIMMTLLLIQFVWGMEVLKESYRFVVSGKLTQTYFKPGTESYWHNAWILIRYNLGTITASAFMQTTLYYIDFAWDFFFSNDYDKFPTKKDDKPENHLQDVKSWRHMDKEDKGCRSLFSLVRGENVPYATIISHPYCDSARACEYMSTTSGFYDYSQTTNRVLRVCSHIIPIFFTVLIAMVKMRTQSSSNAAYSAGFITIICYFTITFFLAFHTDSSDGLLISVFVEEALNDYKLVKAPDAVKKLYEEDNTKVYPGLGLYKLLFDNDMDQKAK